MRQYMRNEINLSSPFKSILVKYCSFKTEEVPQQQTVVNHAKSKRRKEKITSSQ